MPYDFLDKYSPWPEEIECGQDGCKEKAWLVEDQGTGYCSYECPVHGAFGVQYDTPDEDFYDEDLDFGVEFDPFDEYEYEDDD